MDNYIMEQERMLEVVNEYDVVVVGGGIAGISAALAAKRTGAKTILIEREYMLGGLATLGLITIYLPICDGTGRKVSGGIAEELLKLSVKYGAEIDIPREWKDNLLIEERSKKRYMCRFSANMMSLLCEELLIKEGVEILYGTTVCGTILQDERLKFTIMENKSGRTAIKAKSFVDATGDADLAFYSKMNTVLHGEKNKLASWYYAHEKENLKLYSLGVCDAVGEETRAEGEVLDSAICCSGVDAKELSTQVVESHKIIKQHFLENGMISKQRAMVTLATIPQVRMTRRICGEYVLKNPKHYQYYEDSIGMIGDWKEKGYRYEIPFRCLYSRKVKNLIVAGRCISADDEMWDYTRVIPACAVTGEAAGVAAAMSSDFTNFCVKKLQEELVKRGTILHYEANL